jgi:Copper amine oxidase, enzyme domain
MWVTAYHPAQRYAAGDYPNQRSDDDGLPAYVQADPPLADADVWYTFGVHHVAPPRRLAGDAGFLPRVSPQTDRVPRRQPSPRPTTTHHGLLPRREYLSATPWLTLAGVGACRSGMLAGTSVRSVGP